MRCNFSKLSNLLRPLRGALMLPILLRFHGVVSALLFIWPMAAASAANAPLASGHDHTLAIKTDASLWVWGRNDSAQLGDGTRTHRPLPVPLGSGYVSVAAGNVHSAGLKADGTLWSWGHNSWGEVGDGTGTLWVQTPVQIGSGFVAIAAGDKHGVGIKSDGTLWAWGINDYGQVGDGTTSIRLGPVLIGTGFAFVAAGSVA